MKKVMITLLIVVLFVNIVSAEVNSYDEYEIEIEEGKYKLKIDDFEIESESEFIVYDTTKGIKWKHDKSGYNKRKFNNIERVSEYRFCEKEEIKELGKGLSYRKIYDDCIDFFPNYLNKSGMIEYKPEFVNITVIKNTVITQFYADDLYQYDPLSWNYTVGWVACFPYDSDFYEVVTNVNGTWNYKSENVNNSFKKIGGGSLQLEQGGRSEYISYDGVFNVLDANFTITGWAWAPNGQGAGGFIKIGDSNDGVAIGIGSNTMDSSGGELIGLAEAIAWEDSNSLVGTGWFHFGLVVDTLEDFDFYLNGTLVAETAGSIYVPNSYTTVGANSDGNRRFQGYLDEISIWNRVLNSTELEELYNSYNGVSCSDINTSGVSGCTESLVNTSWTSFVSNSSCRNDNTIQYVSNRTTYDENNCGFTNVTFYRTNETDFGCCYQLSTPTNLLNTSQDNDTITLDWDLILGSEKYLIYNFSLNFINDTVPTYIHDNLINNTLYNYTIYAYNSTCVIPLSNVSNNILTYTHQNLPCTTILLNTTWTNWYLNSTCGNLTGVYNRSRITYNNGTCIFVNISFEEFKNDSCECETTNYICRFYEMEEEKMLIGWVLLWVSMVALGYWFSQTGNHYIGLPFLFASTGLSFYFWKKYESIEPVIGLTMAVITLGSIVMWIFLRSNVKDKKGEKIGY